MILLLRFLQVAVRPATECHLFSSSSLVATSLMFITCVLWHSLSATSTQLIQREFLACHEILLFIRDLQESDK